MKKHPTRQTDAGSDTGQRDALLESERDANKAQARNFKEDALDDKVVRVEPDGTGPTPTETFDASKDRSLGSGNHGERAGRRSSSGKREPR